MKKPLLFLLATLLAFAALSCSDGGGGGGSDGNSVTLSLSLPQSASRAAARVDLAGAIMAVRLVGNGYSDTQTTQIYESAEVTFEDVPVGISVVASAYVNAGSNIYYYGSSAPTAVQSGETEISISLSRHATSNGTRSDLVKVGAFEFNQSDTFPTSYGGIMRDGLDSFSSVPAGASFTVKVIDDDAVGGVIVGADRFVWTITCTPATGGPGTTVTRQTAAQTYEIVLNETFPEMGLASGGTWTITASCTPYFMGIARPQTGSVATFTVSIAP